ncbi:MAG: PilZ domain-containing protein [Desulfovibrio sp.]|jgi:hypothetical protein|nr:PilZ domain-containing protein [Desulfovibrio sp.]MBI4960943.1 PilZ domain-containing protein [Desulfovibrio sp.]
MSIRVALVACAGPAREAYVDALRRLGAEAVVFDSPRGGLEALASRDLQGILFDLPTLLRDKSFDKRMLVRLENVIPIMRLRHDPHSGRIDGISGGQAYRTGEALQRFIHGQCGHYSAHALKGAERVKVALPVLLGLGEPGKEDWEKTVTRSISMKGCFVYTATCREPGSRINLVFSDFSDQTPIPAQVSWCVPWGKRREVPGLGLIYHTLTEGQKAELASLGLGTYSSPLAHGAHGV